MQAVRLILKVSVFGTFLGHGILALWLNSRWVPYLTFWGFDTETALQIMPVIGIIDILIAFSVIIKPLRVVLLYATFWAFATAMMRWLADHNFLGFVERAANWGAPLALYFVEKNITKK